MRRLMIVPVLMTSFTGYAQPQQAPTLKDQSKTTAKELLNKAKQALKSDDVDYAIKLLTEAGQNGEGEAWNLLGFIYSKPGLPHYDIKKAFVVYEYGAKIGYPTSCVNLAYCYLDGDGVEANPQKALEWFLKAADLNEKVGQFEASKLLLQGKIVKKDELKAFLLMKKSAENGFPDAMFGLGMMIANGSGTVKNSTESLKWINKAADLGCKDAISFLENN